MVYLSWQLGELPCTVHIFIPTILLFALFRKKGRTFFISANYGYEKHRRNRTGSRSCPRGNTPAQRSAFLAEAGPPHKNKTEVSLGFAVYLRLREPFLRSVADRKSVV